MDGVRGKMDSSEEAVYHYIVFKFENVYSQNRVEQILY